MKHNPIRSSIQSRKYQADVTEDLQIFLCLHRRYNATMIFSRCHQAPSRELEEWIVSSFQSLGDRLETRCGELETTFDRRLDAAEKRVQLIAEGAGLERHVSAGDDDEDRKRLKVARQATDFSEPLHLHWPFLGTLCIAPIPCFGGASCFHAVKTDRPHRPRAGAAQGGPGGEPRRGAPDGDRPRGLGGVALRHLPAQRPPRKAGQPVSAAYQRGPSRERVPFERECLAGLDRLGGVAAGPHPPPPFILVRVLLHSERERRPRLSPRERENEER